MESGERCVCGLLAMFSGVILRGCCCLFALAVFVQASEFNGDVSTWDVSRVTTLFQSKCRGGEVVGIASSMLWCRG